MTIVTLNWTNGVAFGPRGARYEVVQDGGLFSCRVYTADNPSGEQLTANAATQVAAMTAAQDHAIKLTREYGEEGDAINGASDRKRVTITTN